MLHSLRPGLMLTIYALKKKKQAFTIALKLFGPSRRNTIILTSTSYLLKLLFLYRLIPETDLE